MDFYDFRHLLDLPTLRLLRKDHAAMIMGFFFRCFKVSPKLSVPEGQLRAQLEVYLEELLHAGETAFKQKSGATEYLEEWCNKDGFLKKKYMGEQGEPIFELTAGTERALLWLEGLRETSFVATESRLSTIFAGLDELLRYTSEDVEERIQQLLKEQDRIQEEIRVIRATGKVEVFTPVKVNERFQHILATARELMGDFRQVEANFKEIARQIAERHSQPGVTKGAIVGHMLDSHDALRESAQGQSFYAFWELLLSDERQRRFLEASERVYALDSLEDSLRENPLLRRLLDRLLDEGEKVVLSNQRMATNLRRVLETVRLEERRRVLELIHEVQTAALAVKDEPPQDSEFFDIAFFPEIINGLSRPFWTAEANVDLQGGFELGEENIGSDDLRRMVRFPRIQIAKLRGNVEACLLENEIVPLEELLLIHPPKHGLMEILGYLQIASEAGSRHLLNDAQTVVITVPGSTVRWRIPQTVYFRI